MEMGLSDKDIFEIIEPYIKTKGKAFICDICDMKSSNQSRLITHIERQHVDCFSFKCPSCKCAKKSRNPFNHHIRAKHGKNKGELNPIILKRRSLSILKSRRRGSTSSNNSSSDSSNNS